jgi:hypothetical protein
MLPPTGFIRLNGQYILIRIKYASPNEDEPVPNYEYQRIILPVICDIGNAIGALPIPKDRFTVTVPHGNQGETMMLGCTVRHRYFSYPSQVDNSDIVDGIMPDLVAHIVVDGDC